MINYLPYLKKIPIDLGQGHFRHTTKAKLIAFGLTGQGKGKRAIDIGCGDGFWSEKLKKQEWDVVSIDGKDKRYNGAMSVNAEGALPFPDNAFDLVWVCEVLEHIKNLDALITEIERILKPGGLLIATVPNSNFWLFRFFKYFKIHPSQLQNLDHKHFFSYKDIQNIFPKSKIRGFFPYYLIKIPIQKGVSALSPTLIIEMKVPYK
jgi:ubiquinone/menaquinone biosynthesis C-methylase UbiE